MTDNREIKKLLEPGKIGKVRTKNRIIKACGGAEDIGPRNRAFMESLARGGTGLVIWGDVAVEHPRGITIPITERHLQDETNLEAMRQIADAVHRHDCPVFVQIFHTGPQAFLPEGIQTVSASAIDENEQEELLVRQVPHELTIPEIKEMVGKFVRTAELVKEAGFDGVEVNAARMNLINSFLSRAWNRRRDVYGCQNMENRTRFLVEIVKAIKNRLGDDFPVITLINGMEVRIKNGTTIEEAREIAQILEKAGVDALHVRVFGYHGFDALDASPKGTYHSEDTKPLPSELDWSMGGKAALSPLSAAIKKVVSIPVITVGGLEDPLVGEKILEEGKADFIGICKGLMADPATGNKVAEGRIEDIAYCPDCGDCSRVLLSMVMSNEPVAIRCRVNATLGSDQDYEIPAAQKKKKVLVVGGGPGGMEAARVAAIRGHEVVLYEKDNRMGGLLPWVAMIKGLNIDCDVMLLSNYLENQVRKLGVNIRLGEEFNTDRLREVNPDAVILAPGRIAVKPRIEGINNSNVIDIYDLYHGMKDDLDLMEPDIMRGLNRYWESVGKNVVIVGGTVAGSGLAEYLAEKCRNVTIVDTNTIWGDWPIGGSPGLRPVNKMPGVSIEKISDNGITVTTNDGERETIEADTVITAIEPELNRDLFEAVKEKIPETYLLGMDYKEDSIMDTIASGYWTAREI
ncbi:FAD-dependent oxidoreductase [Thermodesulfobacteriota bacterium]